MFTFFFSFLQDGGYLAVVLSVLHMCDEICGVLCSTSFLPEHSDVVCESNRQLHVTGRTLTPTFANLSAAAHTMMTESRLWLFSCSPARLLSLPESKFKNPWGWS